MIVKYIKIFFIVFFFFPFNDFVRGQNSISKRITSIINKYCDNGSRIIELSSEFSKDPDNPDFTEYLSGSTDERSLLQAVNTVVHEECHEITNSRGLQILKNIFGRIYNKFYNYHYFYISDRCSVLIKISDTFPSREMAHTFPEHLRTFRFTYITAKDERQSTQVLGIYGLLDEFNAYYQGTRAALDLLPYYKSKGATANWNDYFQNVNVTLYGCYEFKFYILKYLIYARSYHNDIFQEIQKNYSFIRAFMEIDKMIKKLEKEYSGNKSGIYSLLESYGYEIEEDPAKLSFKKGRYISTYSTFQDIILLLQKEMKKEKYKQIIRGLSQRMLSYEKTHPYIQDSNDLFSASGLDIADTAPIFIWQGRRSDIPCRFADIVAGSIEIHTDSIKANLEIAGMPERFIFNQSEIEPGEKEYEWACSFDMDGDKKGDYSVSLNYFKDGEASQFAGNLLKITDVEFWRIKESERKQMNIDVSVSVSENTITFTLPKTVSSVFLQDANYFIFETFYCNGKTEYRDRINCKLIYN